MFLLSCSLRRLVRSPKATIQLIPHIFPEGKRDTTQHEDQIKTNARLNVCLGIVSNGMRSGGSESVHMSLGELHDLPFALLKATREMHLRLGSVNRPSGHAFNAAIIQDVITTDGSSPMR
jgi:hypothetical protein